jgi:tetratricopeptide (TPR) repeat protein
MDQPLPDFDKLWDYGDPGATERKFGELLPAAERSGDRSYHAQLLSQIARTQGLQDRFDDALATLHAARAIARDDMTLARVRIALEHGRVLNSGGEPAAAMPKFAEAQRLAEQHGYARFAVDAVHMLAIAAPTPREQIDWNLRGIEMVAKDPSQQRWLGPLYNNLGEAYAKAGEFVKALEAFRKLGNDEYALKDQSRMLRAMGNPAAAMAVIEPVVTKRKEPDGWLSEEYAECLLALGRADEATPHFRTAYELLKSDKWVLRHEPAKLEKLRRLGGVEQQQQP